MRFKYLPLFCCCVLVSLFGCKTFNHHDIVKGAQVVSDLCQWVDEEFADGSIVAVCATASEIALFGKHTQPILAARHAAQ